MIPTLSAKAMWISHQVNCNVCNKFTEAHMQEVELPGWGTAWQVITKLKENRKLCPVGAILLNKAVLENVKESPYRPKNFPFVARMYQLVLANHKGRWVTGRVVDKSVNADGGVAGYEIEVTTENNLKGLPPKKEYFYVNRFNITRAEPKPKKSASYNIQPAKTTFKLNIPD